MSEENLTMLAGIAYDTAKSLMKDHGYILPTFITITKSRGIGIATIREWGDPDMKAMVAEAVRQSFKETEATDYIVVCEAWFSFVPIDAEENHPMPRNDPQRKECLTIGGTDLEGHTMMWVAAIIRAEGGSVTLGPLEQQTSEVPFGGVIMSLLDKKESLH